MISLRRFTSLEQVPVLLSGGYENGAHAISHLTAKLTNPLHNFPRFYLKAASPVAKLTITFHSG
jgi:hypothetical protein